MFWLNYKSDIKNCLWHDRWGKGMEWLVKVAVLCSCQMFFWKCISRRVWSFKEAKSLLSFIAFMRGTVRCGWQCGGSCQLGCSQGGVCRRALCCSRDAITCWIWCCPKVSLRQVCPLLLPWCICQFKTSMWCQLFTFISLWGTDWPEP